MASASACARIPLEDSLEDRPTFAEAPQEPGQEEADGAEEIEIGVREYKNMRVRGCGGFLAYLYSHTPLHSYTSRMDSLRRASGFLFYAAGIITLVLIVLSRRGITVMQTDRLLPVIDLPLLFIGMLYGGTSLYGSLTRGRSSPVLGASIFVPLGILLLFFLWLNFAYPLPDIG
jgi:hypothetical protein